MVLSVRVEKPANHSLILGVVFSCFALEKIYAPLAQGNRNLHAFVSIDQVFRPGQIVSNDPEFSQRLVRVVDFLAHKFAFLSANNQRQKSGLRHRGR